MQCFGDLIAMEGTNANEPCRIGSIRPRRQARERRSLQPSKSQVPSGKTMVSMLQMCLPLVRNQLLTTSTPRLSQHMSWYMPLCGTTSSFTHTNKKVDSLRLPAQHWPPGGVLSCPTRVRNKPTLGIFTFVLLIGYVMVYIPLHLFVSSC